MLRCGLKAGGFTVKYEPQLQGITIIITPQAEAKTEQFECIAAASDNEFVNFTDGTMETAYRAWSDEKAKPIMLAQLRDDLAKHGWLKGLPERSDYASDALFAQALERHCGLAPGSMLTANAGELSTKPMLKQPSPAEFNKMSCVLSAVMYATVKDGQTKFGFVGNELEDTKN